MKTIAIVARREMSERIREKAFLVSLGVSLAVVACVAVLPQLLGFGGKETFKIGVSEATVLPVAQAAARGAGAFDATVTVERLAPGAVAAALEEGQVDAVLSERGIRAQEQPDDTLVEVLQAANREVRAGAALREAGLGAAAAARALAPPPLTLSTVEPIDEAAEKRSGFAFFAVLLLYGQLIGFGYFVAMGVVEEKSSRVVELVLSTIRPSQLLAGKIIGLGLLGLGQLMVLALLGLAVAGITGALEVDGDVLAAAALALGWFAVGYAFYASAFACAAALVSRQEDLQTVLMPLTLLLLVSFFVSFAALEDPGGTVATVASFVPPAAPMTMPPRIALGQASVLEMVAAFALTLAAAAALIPIAGRVYSGAILRMGTAVRLRDAWRASRA